jgi:hypothetical protein
MTRHRISLHPSLRSLNDVTTITNTTEYDNAPGTKVTAYTTAVKKRKGFCPVVFFACSSLSLDQYGLTRDTGIINLGTMEDVFTLIVGVFISHVEREYRMPAESFYRMRDIVLAEFRMTILYTFLSIPAVASGHIAYPSSVPDEAPAPGKPELGCEDFFKAQINRLATSAQSFVGNEIEGFPALNWAQNSRCFPAGDYSNSLFQSWRNMMVRKGFMDPETIRTRRRPRTT